ncbi:hypothetical protein ACFWV1_26170 [Streptomyces sp. NPDC058700]|uniref:hypothetical protein n=1 Tax=Streptomyces sp. NPDC058700 TaxID=3346607 RepID=UPI003653D1C0
MATRRASRHNSKGIRHNSIRAADAYRALIRWPDGSSSTFGNHDRARVLAVARGKSAAGATVDFQEHQGWCVYKTTRTFHPGAP